jgi:hypothetical protein
MEGVGVIDLDQITGTKTFALGAYGGLQAPSCRRYVCVTPWLALVTQVAHRVLYRGFGTVCNGIRII